MNNLLIGNERLRIGENEVATTVNDFWRWSASNLSAAAVRPVFAEFLVASSLELLSTGRQVDQPYSILWPHEGSFDIRVGVSSAACPGPIGEEDLGQTYFHLAGGPSCAVYVFCLLKSAEGESPLNTDFWDFYVLGADRLGDVLENQKYINMGHLIRLMPTWSDYYGIGEAIHTTLRRV